MNLSKEQIAEIAKIVTFEKNINPEFTASDINTRLTEKFGQQPGAKEESWKDDGRFPSYQDTYYYIERDGSIGFGMWLNTEEQKASQSIGNIYRTKEEAENKVRLLQHIQKFPIKEGEGYFFLETVYEDNPTPPIFDESDFEYLERKGFEFVDVVAFNSGILMPLSSTEEDRAERIDLLKKCFS